MKEQKMYEAKCKNCGAECKTNNDFCEPSYCAICNTYGIITKKH